MKTQGKLTNTNVNLFFIILAAGMLLTLPIRTYQMINIVEPETGFYTTSDFTVILLYSLMELFTLLFFVLSRFNKSLPAAIMPEGKSTVLSVFSILFSATLLFDAVIQIENYSQIYYAYGSTYGSSTQTFGRYLMTSGGLPLLIQSIFAVLSALYFFILAISYVKGGKMFETLKILALSPVVWTIARMVYRFIQPINFRNVSQLFLGLFMIVFMMLFLMSFARIASSVNQEKSVWLLYASGLSGALFATVCGVSLLILTVIGRSDLICPDYPLEYCDVGFLLFAVALLFEMTKNPKAVDTVSAVVMPENAVTVSEESNETKTDAAPDALPEPETKDDNKAQE